MSKIGQAIALAADVHQNQTDKAGVPYILHPLAVMELCRSYTFVNDEAREDCLIAAVLHDVMEDHDEPEDEFEGVFIDQIGDHILDTFGGRVFDAVEKLTKPRGAEYEKYIENLRTNWVARRVKIADLTHNLEPMRMPNGRITDRDFERWNKYHKALVSLRRKER
jgi:guanosine-3',5'-bis(diphosphate) 3'-pyrophosphohydrolase